MKHLFLAIFCAICAVLTGCSTEIYDSIPAASMPLWQHEKSVLLHKATTVAGELVNFEVTIQDYYLKVEKKDTLRKDTIRTISFAEKIDPEWRNLGISLTKGGSYYQKEFTNHNNMMTYPVVAVDTVRYEVSGWNIWREDKVVDGNYVSTTNPDDNWHPVLTMRSFGGSYNDAQYGLVEFESVILNYSLRPNIFSHHYDLSIQYDAENCVWIDRPFDYEDIQSPVAIETADGKWYMRYAICWQPVVESTQYNIHQELSSELEYWIEFNRDEWLAEHAN